MPTNNKWLNSRQCSVVVPPITSTNSGVNLKGDCSKPAQLKYRTFINEYLFYEVKRLPKFLGDMLRIKPKSMWIM